MNTNVRENTCDFRLQASFGGLIAGPSKAGKSTLICELIKNRNTWINGKIEKVVYCYVYLSKELSSLQAKEPDSIVLVDNLDDIESHLTKHCLLVVDDGLMYMDNTKYVRKITEFFTQRIHHQHISCLLVTQNVFHASLRTIAINSDFICLFNSPRNKGTVIQLAKDFSPHNIGYVLEAFKRAVHDKPHAYIVFDFRQSCPDRFRLRDKLYPDKDMNIFVPQ